jgi:hypothetical protein
MKVSNTKFHGNPSSGSQADICGQTDGQTDMTKLTGTFPDYGNASKIAQTRTDELMETATELLLNSELKELIQNILVP